MEKTLDSQDVDDLLEDVAFAQLPFSPGAQAQSRRGHPVDVSQAAESGLMDHRDGGGG